MTLQFVAMDRADAPPTPAGEARHRLADSLRAMMDVLIDSSASEADLHEAAAGVDAVRRVLEAAPKWETLGADAESATTGEPRSFDSNPVVGLANPVAPPLRLAIVGDRVEGSGSFGSAYEGPPGHVHGGMVAAAFDQLLGLAQSLSGSGGMTGSLTVRYRKPTPLHRELRFEGRLDRVEGRKIFTSGSLFDGETLLAEAEGLFISVDFARRFGR
jgi:hypothetical protein